MKGKPLAVQAKHPRKSITKRVLGKGQRVSKGLGKKMAGGGRGKAGF